MTDAADRSGVGEVTQSEQFDPRVIDAAERTLLAWIRTGLALMGFGFLVAKFGIFLRGAAIMHGGKLVDTPRWSVWIGIAMVVMGVVANVVAGTAHLQFLKDYCSSEDPVGHAYRMSVSGAFAMGLVGVFTIIYLLSV